ncbi:MAG: hypothetical protein E7055_09495 [Lentisphaerae bacterium]|nr:hypothetical protein [Lentisphaerota bacterium]
MRILQPGDVFAGCRILSYCGSGGMGSVYLAADAMQRKIALKIVNTAASERELEGIRKYIQAAAGKPGLIQIHHAGIEQDSLFYLMEAADPLENTGDTYIPKTLETVLKRDGKLDPGPALDLIRNLSLGLEALHAAGLIHRDIKPGNIIFADGVPKLCDPGLVCAMDATATLAGTLGFLPPECFKGAEINTAGRDLYALGKVFYVAVTGEPPSRYPHIPSDLSLSVRRKIWPVLTRVCDTNPKHRFQKTEDFRQALPSSLPNPGRLELALNSFRQWRLANPGIVSGAILIFLLILILGFAIGAYRIRNQRQHAEFLRDCQRQCEAVSVRFMERKSLLAGQLADLAGETEAKKIGQTLRTLPEDPAERLKIYRRLDAQIGKLAHDTLLPVPEQASAAEICRISDRNRGLLASPLGAWIAPEERKRLIKKLESLEKQFFSAGIQLRPGKAFLPDSSFRQQYNYVPAGVFRRKNGQLVRLPHAFWCCDGELRADNFLPAMQWLKSSEKPGVPMGRFSWNDLLEYCRRVTTDYHERGMIPKAYIFRPLTAAEWQWACRGAWSGPGNASAFLKKNSGGRLHPVRSGEPNSLGLYDFIGNSAEMVIPDSGLDSGHCIVFCGGWYDSPKADPEKCSPYLKYQWLPPYIGARIGIVRSSMEFFERALWLTGPRETAFGGRHYELLVSNATHINPESARKLCRLLGGRLLVPESSGQLKAFRKAFFETNSFPVAIDGILKGGVWLRPDGSPNKGVPLPEIPKHPTWFLAFHQGKIRCYPSARATGLICEWNEAEYRRRNDRNRIRRSGVFGHAFRIGSTQYFLVHCPVYPHTARRIAQLLGAKLAQPRTPAIRERFLQELGKWKPVPVMLGGHWKYGHWELADGSPLEPALPLRGTSQIESMNLASPGLFDGEFCALQQAQAFLLELPLE